MDTPVDHVGEDEVDQPVRTTERHRGLRTVCGERHETLAGAAGQHDAEDAFLSNHDVSFPATTVSAASLPAVTRSAQTRAAAGGHRARPVASACRASAVAVIHAVAAARTAAGMASMPWRPASSVASSIEANSSRVIAAIPAAAPTATASVGETPSHTTAIIARAMPRKTAGKTGPPRKPHPRHTA